MNKYKIYCDLDGVLVNFDKGVSEALKLNSMFKNQYESPTFMKKMWNTIDEMTKNKEPFWEDLDPTPDYDILWNHIKKYDVSILTATGIRNIEETARQKKNWCKKYLGDVEVIAVNTAGDKCIYANELSVLIDDRRKAIDPWLNMNGIGILHTNSRASINLLKRYTNL